MNTTIFSVVNAVLLKHFPFRDPEQLVSVHRVLSRWIAGHRRVSISRLEKSNTNFDDLAAFTDNNFNLTGNGEPERTRARK